MTIEEDKTMLESSASAEQDIPVEPGETVHAPTPTLEDKPVEFQKPEVEPAPVAPVVKKESWATRALRWLLVAILFLLIGAAAVYFALTMPAKQQITGLNLAASASADKIATLDSDLKAANSSLVVATAAVNTQSAQIISLSLKNAVYKMQMDVDTIRISLLKLDTITATQALGAARLDITALESLGVDKATLDGFATRLVNAEINLSADPQKSMAELDNLIGNLYLLESNLP
ncbi:hypothetical protein EG834_21410 [bacterium]|nr:hypothetical protein [bacterium]